MKWLKNLDSQDEVRSFYQEIEFLSTLRHPNIVSMYGISRITGKESQNKNQSICLVTEFIEGGSLESRMGKLNQIGIDNCVKNNILKCIASAM